MVFHSIKETESEIEQDLINQVNETLESEDPAHTKENYYRDIIELSQYYIIKKFTQYIPIHTNMTTEQLNKANKIQETLESLYQSNQFLQSNDPDGKAYNISIQVGRKSFPILDNVIRDKVIELINQRIKELEEEFKTL